MLLSTVSSTSVSYTAYSQILRVCALLYCTVYCSGYCGLVAVIIMPYGSPTALCYTAVQYYYTVRRSLYDMHFRPWVAELRMHLRCSALL
jgi:hypothetical protein